MTSITAANPRGAGRKATFTDEQIATFAARRAAGESVTALAAEAHVSRQTMSTILSKHDEGGNIYTNEAKWMRLNKHFEESAAANATMRIEVLHQDNICAAILVDFARKNVAVTNYTNNAMLLPFGIKARPTWEDFEDFLGERCVPKSRAHMNIVLDDMGLDFYDPLCIIEKTGGRMAEDNLHLRLFYFKKTLAKKEVPHA